MTWEEGGEEVRGLQGVGRGMGLELICLSGKNDHA